MKSKILNLFLFMSVAISPSYLQAQTLETAEKNNAAQTLAKCLDQIKGAEYLNCEQANRKLQNDSINSEPKIQTNIEYSASVGMPVLESVKDYTPEKQIISVTELEIPLEDNNKQGENYKLQAIDIVIEFDFNSAKIRKEEETKISALAAAFASDILKEDHFILIGHTDARGNEAYNCTLSTNRALSVKNALLSKGVSPDQIDIIGVGEYLLKDKLNPQADQNRRVSITKRVEEVETIIPSLIRLCAQ